LHHWDELGADAVPQGGRAAGGRPLDERSDQHHGCGHVGAGSLAAVTRASRIEGSVVADGNLAVFDGRALHWEGVRTRSPLRGRGDFHVQVETKALQQGLKK
jgi:hypothetical protein